MLARVVALLLALGAATACTDYQQRRDGTALGQRSAGDQTARTTSAARRHLVLEGETLSGIAQRYRVRMDALAKLNRQASEGRYQLFSNETAKDAPVQFVALKIGPGPTIRPSAALISMRIHYSYSMAGRQPIALTCFLAGAKPTTTLERSTP